MESTHIPRIIPAEKINPGILFFDFVFSKLPLTLKFFWLISDFEPETLGVGSDHSANRATATARNNQLFALTLEKSNQSFKGFKIWRSRGLSLPINAP